MFDGWGRRIGPFWWKLANVFYSYEHHRMGTFHGAGAKGNLPQGWYSSTSAKAVAFQKETAQYQPLESYIDCIEDEKSLNFFLKKNMVELGISIPWEGDFDTFMRDKSRHLIYE